MSPNAAPAQSRCPITYELVQDGVYSASGLRKLSPKLTTLHPLPYTSARLREEAVARSSKMSIQGVQPKVSAVLNVREGRFEVVDKNGRYILKPQTGSYAEVPENEDLTMRMAAAVKIDVPLHGLVYTADGALCYFIRRFDRLGRDGKIPVEDFAQLMGFSRTTKYDSYMEQVAKGVKAYCTFPAKEKVELFRRTLFSFLTGNEDMHLKNFSLITDADVVRLSPAYDLLNSTIVLAKAEEEMALPIRGKRSNLKRSDLVDYYGLSRLRLTAKVIDRVLQDFAEALAGWQELVASSFLSADMQARYLAVLEERCNRLAF